MRRERREIKLPFGWEIYFWHLEESQMSYREHMKRSFGFALVCAVTCFKAVIHGIVPCWFENNESCPRRKAG